MQHAPEIKTWHIGDKYLIEVRANEFSYHPPHFHATANEYAAVFRLSDGKVIYIINDSGCKETSSAIRG